MSSDRFSYKTLKKGQITPRINNSGGFVATENKKVADL